MFPVAILAGGLATRLHTLTRDTPKSLLPVAGRPFLLHQLELLRSQQIEHVVLCVGHLGEQICALIGDGRAHGLSVKYSFDGPTALGTGGALRQAVPMLGPCFFVLYGDSYLPCDFGRVQSAFEHCGRSALMTVLRNENRWDRSNVVLGSDGAVRYDKSLGRDAATHIDFGLSVLRPSVLLRRASGTAFDLAEVYSELSHSGDLAGYEVAQRFYEIGSLQGLRDTEAFLSAPRTCATIHAR